MVCSGRTVDSRGKIKVEFLRNMSEHGHRHFVFFGHILLLSIESNILNSFYSSLLWMM